MSNNRPERVGAPGLSNKDPGAGMAMRAVGRGRSRKATGSTLANNRRKRIERLRAKQAEEAARKKELEKDATEKDESAGTMGLGLFLFSSQVDEKDPAGKAMGKLIQETADNGFGKKTTMVGREYKLVEMVGRNARLKELFSLTEEYGLVWDYRGELPQNTVFDFKIKITDGDESRFGVVTLFNGSGKILIKGGYFNCTNKNDFSGLEGQPRALLMALFQMYGYKPQIPPLTRVNTVASYRTGRKFDDKEFRRNTVGKIKVGEFLFDKAPVKNRSVTKTYMKLAQDKHEISITKMGVVQVSFKGQISKETLKKYFSKIKNFDKTFSKYFKGSSKVFDKKKKSTLRANNAPAPNVVRRGTTCPPDKRPTPYSYAGKCPEGTYVRPNPQQQPCCYKIGKRPTRMSNKVKLAYNKAGVAIPSNVSKLFGIKSNKKAVNVSTNLPSLKMYKTVTRVRKSNGTMVNVPDVRIGTRQCLRYTKEKIVDFIIRTGYAETGLESKTKEELCKILYSLVKNTNVNQTNNKFIPKANGKTLTLKLGKILMIGRRECDSLPKAEIQKVCKSLGINYEGKSRPEMCKSINEKRISMQEKLNKKKENKITENIRENVRKEFAQKNKEEQARRNKLKKRDKVIYQMFVTRVEPFVSKYEKYGSRNTLPSQNKVVGDFRISVDIGAARPFENVNKRGWKKPFESWLKEYTQQYKDAYEQYFIDAKVREEERERMARANAKEKALAEKERKKVLAAFPPEKALADMEKFKQKLPKNLQNVFNKKKEDFAKNYRNFVIRNATLQSLPARKKAYFNFESAIGGKIRNTLNREVNKMKPLILNKNTFQKYTLNRNFKLVLGPKLKGEII